MVIRTTLVSFLATLALLVAVPASAKDGDVLLRGTCGKASTSKLKLSPENGRIEIEFEVDQNRNGIRWTVVLKRATGILARGARTTRPPSGSFEFRRVVSNLAGQDRITARATSPTGEVCRATAAI